MLAEFLLTPDALSDDDGRSGSDVVRELADCFFPRRTVPLALLCKLGDDEWERATSRRIAQIKNPSHRQDAMSLFQKLLSQICVTRPRIHLASEDESGWIKAGMTSASQVLMNGIVVSSKSTPPDRLGVSLKDFVSDVFWRDLGNPRFVGRDTVNQEQVLRAICLHSDWLVIRLPQIRGGSDDEIVTVRQILKLSNQLPSGFRKTAIDLHVCMQPRISKHRLIRGISDELSTSVQQGVQIRLTIWPERHFINRELLGGDYTKTSPGDLVRRPLWWITMNHVAIGSRQGANRGDGANAWSLFSRQKAYERHEQIKDGNPIESVSLRESM